LIVACTLRADHLGCYGYEKGISPNIDKMAKGGALFNNCISQAPFTLYSIASMIASKYPEGLFYRGINGKKKKVLLFSKKNTTIAKILKLNGYKTFCFSANPWISKSKNFDQGYDYFLDLSFNFRAAIRNPSKNTSEEKLSAQEVIDMVLEKIKTDNSKKRFFKIVLVDTHGPYKKIPSPKKNAGKYDQMIHYLDGQIGRLLGELKKQDLLKNSLIVFTSDHGQGFGEPHKQDVSHGHFLYNTVVKVPLIFYGECIKKNIRVNSAVPLLDIVPTLLDISGVDFRKEKFDGKSLKSVIVQYGNGIPSRDNIFTATNFPPRNSSRLKKWAVIHKGQWKYIKNVFGKKSQYDEELYNLTSDPYEANNLAQKETKLKSKLKNIGSEWVKNRRISTEKADGNERGNKIIDRQLRSLGYLN